MQSGSRPLVLHGIVHWSDNWIVMFSTLHEKHAVFSPPVENQGTIFPTMGRLHINQFNVGLQREGEEKKETVRSDLNT